MQFLDFKLSPCSLCSMFSFGYFPGVWGLKADVSEPSIGSIFIGTSLWRWNRQRVPKRRLLKLRRQGNTQKKTYYKVEHAHTLFILHQLHILLVGPVAQSVWRLTTGWTIRDRIPVGTRFTGPGVHPASCTMGTASFPGVKCGRGVLLTTHPLPVPRSWKSRAIPLPTLWATPGL
jgi:hypothetical protein